MRVSEESVKVFNFLIRFVVIAALLLPVTELMSGEKEYIDQVNPFIGTKKEHGRGRTFPWAGAPFGMTEWTPETQMSEPLYRWEHSEILSFRGTHYPGSWRSDYGSVSLMPMTGSLSVVPEERGSRFSHNNETAEPGYYQVYLQDYDVNVEITGTIQSGFFRFTYPETDSGYVIIDTHPEGGYVKILPEEQMIVGYNSRRSWRSPISQIVGYFAAKFSKPFAEYGTWNDSTLYANSATREGNHPGAYIRFATEESEEVQLKIGTSFISTDQAEANLNAQLPDWNFKKAQADMQQQWEEILSRVEVEGGTEDQRTIFYTALWNLYRLPRIMSEQGRYWSVFDSTVHDVEWDGEWYGSGEAFWDTFRAKHPLLTILEPGVENQFVRSMLDMYDQSGWIPKRPNPGFTDGMIATHHNSIIASAYARGIDDYEVEKAYKAIRQDGMEEGPVWYEAREQIWWYKLLGYVPSDKAGKYRERVGGQATSKTLEFAFDDFAIAQMAKGLGKQDDYEYFLKRAKNYQYVFDPVEGFVRGRNADGTWTHKPFDPTIMQGPFTEATPWQYTFHVQQDFSGLRNLMGRKRFINRLDSLLILGRKHGPDFVAVPTETGNRYYWQGNEPVQHSVFGFNYAGVPWKTQYWAREIMDLAYMNSPAGMPGDEDQGQISAWYIFNAMGFYPTNPALTTYDIGSPIFDKVTIHLDSEYNDGGTFVIRSVNNSPRNRYIQSLTLNGHSHDQTFITHEDITTGGELVFEMGPYPNKKWGSDRKSYPPAITQGTPEITLSNLETSKVRDRILITVEAENAGAFGSLVIPYRIDGNLIARKSVILEAGETREVQFETLIQAPGDYTLEVADFTPVQIHVK